jgi:predicted GNAT family N-acyltransferase
MARAGDRAAWHIEPLAKRHDRAAFSCGKAPLDRYLKVQAGQDARRRVAAPFVLVETPGNRTVMGYYTLSAFGVDLGELPEELAKKLPHYPVVPAVLLGRLAVDRRYRGRGFGETLLMNALHRSLAQSSEIAAAAVVVDAMDEDATRFYRHFNFIALPERRGRLFLPMKAVDSLFR